MRPSHAVLVLALVLLAGCGAGSGPASPSPTATPTPSDVSPTPGPGSEATLDPASVPGVSADGVDVDRLTAAHDAALNRTAYTLNLSVRRGDTRQRITVATTGTAPTRFRRSSGSRVRDEYFTADRFYRRDVVDGNVSYRSGPFVGDPTFSAAQVVRRYMSVATYEPAGTTTTRSGDPVVVLAADREDLVENDVIPVDTTETFASRARVDADGVVRSFVLVARGTTADGRPFVVRVELRVTGIGDTVVETPEWLDEARAATGGTATP